MRSYKDTYINKSKKWWLLVQWQGYGTNALSFPGDTFEKFTERFRYKTQKGKQNKGGIRYLLISLSDTFIYVDIKDTKNTKIIFFQECGYTSWKGHLNNSKMPDISSKLSEILSLRCYYWNPNDSFALSSSRIQKRKQTVLFSDRRLLLLHIKSQVIDRKDHIHHGCLQV